MGSRAKERSGRLDHIVSAPSSLRQDTITPLSNAYRGYFLPGVVIAHAVWLYLRFPLSLRDVEEILAGRGIGVTHETIRCWVTKFGSQFASRLRKREARPGRV